MKAEELLYAQTTSESMSRSMHRERRSQPWGLAPWIRKALTDLVFLQASRDWREPVRAGKRFGEIESVKAVSDL